MIPSKFPTDLQKIELIPSKPEILIRRLSGETNKKAKME